MQCKPDFQVAQFLNTNEISAINTAQKSVCVQSYPLCNAHLRVGGNCKMVHGACLMLLTVVQWSAQELHVFAHIHTNLEGTLPACLNRYLLFYLLVSLVNLICKRNEDFFWQISALCVNEFHDFFVTAILKFSIYFG